MSTVGVPVPISLGSRLRARDELRFWTPAHGVARVTLAWLGPDGPLFLPAEGGHTTVVVAWDVDVHGRVRLAPEGTPEPRVLQWTLTGRELDQLERLATAWPPSEHDLRVEPHRVSPCPATLRRWDGFALLSPAIDRAVSIMLGGPSIT